MGKCRTIVLVTLVLASLIHPAQAYIEPDALIWRLGRTKILTTVVNDIEYLETYIAILKQDARKQLSVKSRKIVDEYLSFYGYPEALRFAKERFNQITWLRKSEDARNRLANDKQFQASLKHHFGIQPSPTPSENGHGSPSNTGSDNGSIPSEEKKTNVNPVEERGLSMMKFEEFKHEYHLLVTGILDKKFNEIVTDPEFTDRTKRCVEWFENPEVKYQAQRVFARSLNFDTRNKAIEIGTRKAFLYLMDIVNAFLNAAQNDIEENDLSRSAVKLVMIGCQTLFTPLEKVIKSETRQNIQAEMRDKNKTKSKQWLLADEKSIANHKIWQKICFWEKIFRRDYYHEEKNLKAEDRSAKDNVFVSQLTAWARNMLDFGNTGEKMFNFIIEIAHSYNITEENNEMFANSMRILETEVKGAGNQMVPNKVSQSNGARVNQTGDVESPKLTLG